MRTAEIPLRRMCRKTLRQDVVGDETCLDENKGYDSKDDKQEQMAPGPGNLQVGGGGAANLYGWGYCAP